MPALIFDDIRVLAQRLKGSTFCLMAALEAHGLRQCSACMVWKLTDDFHEDVPAEENICYSCTSGRQ